MELGITYFDQATLTVKIVMIILIIASIWSWTVIIEKLIYFPLEKRRIDRTVKKVFATHEWDKRNEELNDKLKAKKELNMTELLFYEGMSELGRETKSNDLSETGISRIERILDLTLMKVGDKYNSGLYLLATVGSVAPFIGLFGTVWGIKNSFEEIASQQNTNLAIVAPGIAEALLATALGLLAAIPAVIFYNKLSKDAERLISFQEIFLDRFLRELLYFNEILKGRQQNVSGSSGDGFLMKGLGSGQSKRGSRSRSSRQSLQLMSEINVTPFVDVMLVLLIIFMITAPMLTVGIEIEIPESNAKSIKTTNSDETPFELYVNDLGEVSINNTLVNDSQMIKKLEVIANQRDEKILYVKADGRNSYGRVSKILGELDNAEFLDKYVLVHLPESGKVK